MGSSSASGVAASAAQPDKPQDAVLVFGSTGKLGRMVVKEVLTSCSGPHMSMLTSSISAA